MDFMEDSMIMGLKRIVISLICFYLILSPVLSEEILEIELELETFRRKYRIRKLRPAELIFRNAQRKRRRQTIICWLIILLTTFVSVRYMEGTYHSFDPSPFWYPLILSVKHIRNGSAGLTGLLRAEEKEGKIVIEYSRPTRIEIDGRDNGSIEAEIARLCFLKDDTGKKYVTQEQMSRVFKISRQMINRRKRLVDERGLLDLLKGEYETEVLRPEVRERIISLLVDNWNISEKEIVSTLISEGCVKTISVGSVNRAIKNWDGRKIRKLMRRMMSQQNPDNNDCSSKYLLDRAFELLEDVMSRLRRQEHPFEERYNQLRMFGKAHIDKIVTGVSGENTGKRKYERDQAYAPQHLSRTRRRKKKLLRGLIYGDISQGEREVICPDCLSADVRYVFRRSREYTDEKGQKHKGRLACIYRCHNSGCGTKYFTSLPPGLELWARYNISAKRKIFNLIFHVRGTFRRCSDYLRTGHGINISWSTLSNHVRKVGAECPLFEDIFPIRWSKKLIVDEKYIKLFKDWVYLYVAVDESTGECLCMDVFRNKGSDSVRLFLLNLKSMGYYPGTIVTDLCPDYPPVIKKVFPDAYHHQCVLHAEKAAKRLVNEYLTDDPRKENLKKEIRFLFDEKKLPELDKKYQRFVHLRENYPGEAKNVFDMVENYYQILRETLNNLEIPRTSNVVENLIKEFDLKYQNTMGYSSLEAVREFVRAYLIYLRLTPKNAGKSKGFSPAQLARDKIIPITWYQYLLVA